VDGENNKPENDKRVEIRECSFRAFGSNFL